MANTTRFGIEIPDVGADADTWGTILNNYFNGLEALVFDKRGDTVNGNFAYTGTLVGGTGIINIGSGQVYKDAAGNVGIGTSSPSGKLHILGSSGSVTRTSVGTNANQVFHQVDNSVNTVEIGVLSAGSAYVSANGTFPLQFFVNNGLRATLDPAGNLGLGVVPSAWTGLSNNTLETSSYALLNIGQNAAYFTQNVTHSGGGIERYRATFAATRYRQIDGAHRWDTAPSGTAGAAISFTQAMTLDAPATPRLLIGTTTAGVGNSNNTNLTVTGGATVYQSVLASGGQELNLIAQSGLVGVYARSNDPLLFGTNNTERARITAAGDFLIANTVANGTPAQGFQFVAGAASTGYVGHVNGSASGSSYFEFDYNSTKIGSITQNGTTAVAFNTTSDYRLKNNVRSADAKSFDKIRFVDFEWSDGRHDCGVIAHELQAIYPDLVVGEKDATEIRKVEVSPAIAAVVDEDGNEVSPAIDAVFEDQVFPSHQQVNYIGLIPRMGTVIQQLMTQVATLEARLAALEAK